MLFEEIIRVHCDETQCRKIKRFLMLQQVVHIVTAWLYVVKSVNWKGFRHVLYYSLSELYPPPLIPYMPQLSRTDTVCEMSSSAGNNRSWLKSGNELTDFQLIRKAVM
jgi:hypothetical protein